jgi:hypothetical protein
MNVNYIYHMRQNHVSQALYMVVSSLDKPMNIIYVVSGSDECIFLIFIVTDEFKIPDKPALFFCSVVLVVELKRHSGWLLDMAS